jgi:hypothetical protein
MRICKSDRPVDRAGRWYTNPALRALSCRNYA